MGVVNEKPVLITVVEVGESYQRMVPLPLANNVTTSRAQKIPLMVSGSSAVEG